jgi:amino acid adenylation domain-containing protein
MRELSKLVANVPPEQQKIRAKCFHSSGHFEEFKEQEVDQSIPQRFEKIVRMYPNHIALKTAKESVRYSELNAMANRLAHAVLALRGNNAEPVALLCETGVELMAAMVGVLKAGKFFVILDPSFPKSRIVNLLEDSRAKLLVTNRRNLSLAQEVVASTGLQIMEFESLDGGIVAERLGGPVSPKALAFNLYTSGSSGRPKGVLWNHRNLLHNMSLFTNLYHVCDNDRLSMLSSGTANAVMNTFVTLLNGARLVLFDVKKEGVSRLASWLLQEKISICLISSPLFRNLAETLTGKETFHNVRILRLTSEAVYKTDVDFYKKFFPPTCIFVNALNSSETGLLRTYFLDHETSIACNEVPVGYAVEDKEIFLLDDLGKKIGCNEPGEISIRSRYLSSGYWREPNLTKKKFIEDPEGGKERIYLTGDVGVVLSDGCLIYRGRKDFRAKIRGYGVEIAEVERALLAHKGVKQGVVIARKNALGEDCLVAYVTSLSGLNLGVGELRSFLTGTLPEYMVPSAFVILDNMPLTPNGKIDRQSLPEPGNKRPTLDVQFVEPQTVIEAQLARIWAEVLGVDQVGIYDNFFDLGGHSLSGSQILSRTQTLFDVELPLDTLLDEPTIKDLALAVTAAMTKV